MPGATVRAFSSPVMMLIANPSGEVEDRMDRAALGPTPDTPMSSRKQFFSSSVAKP